MKYYLGVDLGGTNIAVGIVNEDKELLETMSRPTGKNRSAAEIVEDIAALSSDLMTHQGASCENLISVGVGVPGSVNKKLGTIVYANNLGFVNVPFVSLMKKHFSVPVYMDNDANVAALAEYTVGCGKECDSFILVTLGTGVGAGIIINHQLVTGCNYGAGEIGHMVIDMHGKKCNCGRRGCYELYASATALVEQAREAMLWHPESKLWELCQGREEDMNGKLLFDGVRAGDMISEDVLKHYVNYLSIGILDLINMMQPDVLCIGGGISKAGNLILNPLKKLVAEKVYTRDDAIQTEIKIAELDNGAGILGAAFLQK